jgi:hypothetical protein
MGPPSWSCCLLVVAVVALPTKKDLAAAIELGDPVLDNA